MFLLLRWSRLVYNDHWHGCARDAFASLIAVDVVIMIDTDKLVRCVSAARLVAVDVHQLLIWLS